MARLELLGFEDLDDAFKRIADIPESTTIKALGEMADVAAKAIKASGEAMGVRDPESDTHILDKIKTTKPKVTEAGGYQDITFSGTRKRGESRTRNAEIAFVNEYGKEGQPARPFVGKGMNTHEKQIQDAGGEVIGDWIEKNF